MRELEEFFSSLQRNGTIRMVDLYEQVQSCGHVVPRLYLLCCVGGVYITSLEAPAKDILKDMLEMSKGVQHNMRGLFLRCYLTQISRNKLPDIGTIFEGAGGNVQDACNFLITNFCETNRLWVRLQTQGASKDRKKREKERQDLRILVGTNLVRLSQLDGLDVIEYKANVLPKILEEIVSSKDTIAQSYLMDCIIQVFPDDFHLATLESFLATCKELKEKVPVRTILESMMDRLANYAANAGTASGQVLATLMEINAFKLFNDCVTALIMERSNMTLPETLRLQIALTKFALKCYPGRMDYITHTLNTACSLIEKADFKVETVSQGDEKSEDDTSVQIEGLLSAPLSTLSLRVMELPAFAKLMSFLPWGNWKEVSSTLLKSAISANTRLTEVEHIEQLFKMITPLLRDKDLQVPTRSHADDDDEDAKVGPATITQAFKEEQLLVARVVHLMKNDNTDIQLKMYHAAKTHFTNGGASRIQFTLAPLVFGALALARRVHAREKAAEAGDVEAAGAQFSSRKVFQFIIEIVTAMATSLPDLSLRLFLNAAQAADEFSYSAIAYEFFKEALLIYESEISDSKAQVNNIFLKLLFIVTFF
jgi:vacuolar protein sorting-associated protein 35